MGKIKGWKKDKKIWKGSNWLFYHAEDEGAVHYNYIQIGKVESEDSPYYKLWFIDWHTPKKMGKSYVSSRQKAVSWAMKYMRENPNG